MSTEREMLDLVHNRYAAAFNGTSPRYVVAEHVQFNPTFATLVVNQFVG